MKATISDWCYLALNISEQLKFTTNFNTLKLLERLPTEPVKWTVFIVRYLKPQGHSYTPMQNRIKGQGFSIANYLTPFFGEDILACMQKKRQWKMINKPWDISFMIRPYDNNSIFINGVSRNLALTSQKCSADKRFSSRYLFIISFEKGNNKSNLINTSLLFIS